MIMGDIGASKNGYQGVGGEWLGKMGEWRMDWARRTCVALASTLVCFLLSPTGRRPSRACARFPGVLEGSRS